MIKICYEFPDGKTEPEVPALNDSKAVYGALLQRRELVAALEGRVAHEQREVKWLQHMLARAVEQERLLAAEIEEEVSKIMLARPPEFRA